MISFLEETIDTLRKKHRDISKLTIILPSKRAGGFFKNYLRASATKTSFLPHIISIEEFVESLSDLHIIDNSKLILRSYDAYLQTESISEKEAFETYTSWIQTLLNDFNEIDRHLVPVKAFFNYLSSIKSLEKWSVTHHQTELIENYLSFWRSLPEFYNNLRQLLLNEGLGYQGMVYRKASEELEHYIKSCGDRIHVFIGFNALNKAEQYIIKELLETGNSEIYFDADSYFFNDEGHSASAFMTAYFSSWKYLQNNPPPLGSHFEKQKSFEIIETQQNIAQVKYAGQLLSGFTKEELNNTAVVLADEQLLIPLLYSLPENVKQVNITMGVPLQHLPITQFFLSLLRLHQNRPERFYYKDVFSILKNSAGKALLPEAESIVEQIMLDNNSFISLEEMEAISAPDNKDVLRLLFGDWGKSPKRAIDNSMALLLELRKLTSSHPVEKVLVYEIYSIFEKLYIQCGEFKHIESIKSLQLLFSESVSTATMDFKGDAYEGLQIMGVLETRVLDFENVILLSVNEGILPSGKSNSSFITFDLKTQFDLPLYTDKDAIYTYHFYHLLQRASKVWLLYNQHAEGLNVGEKSRFLLQLEMHPLPMHQFKKVLLTPNISMEHPALRSIAKNSRIINQLTVLAESGFSPSALTAYIRNPLDFYLERILKIKEAETVEETIEYNTLGTIVHNTLQTFYEPFQGVYLSEEVLKNKKEQVLLEVTRQFKNIFKKGSFTKGRNLLIFEVAKRFVENLIDLDIREIENGNKIKIVQIERKLKVPIQIPELPFPVNIRGTVDRVDEFNGIVRIIDYKTGSVKQGDLEITDWSELVNDYKYSKAFQVLAYAKMLEEEIITDSAEAGVISFKNMAGGFLKFGTKESSHSRNKEQQITSEVLNSFTRELKLLIREICNPDIPFVEKEV